MIKNLLIKNLIFMLGPFVVIRSWFVFGVTGYRPWYLILDIPLGLIMTLGAWLKTGHDMKWKAEIEEMQKTLEKIRNRERLNS